MAIISGKRSNVKEKVKAEINAETLNQINQYCQWASIEDIGFFFEEAAHFVFAKDKDWKQHKKSAKKAKKEMA
jgi:hypothetical protein